MEKCRLLDHHGGIFALVQYHLVDVYDNYKIIGWLNGPAVAQTDASTCNKDRKQCSIDLTHTDDVSVNVNM